MGAIWGLYEGFPKLGVPFQGPHNKDYSIWGSILGSPYFWETTIWGLYRDNGKENGHYYILIGYILGNNACLQLPNISPRRFEIFFAIVLQFGYN